MIVQRRVFLRFRTPNPKGQWGIINSTDEADQDEITNYVSEECGVELPSF